jgi:hypothetical protein
VVTRSRNLLFLSKDWSEPTNLGAKRSANMLRLVGDQLLYAGHNLVQEGLTLQQRAEA